MNNINHCKHSCLKELNESDLYSPEEAFMRGNVFKDLYSPYCRVPNFVYRPTTHKDNALLKLSILEFYVHELNLYLNTHPHDQNALTIFNKYIVLRNEAKNEFEKQYGPLSFMANQDCNDWLWVKDPWPWMNERKC